MVRTVALAHDSLCTAPVPMHPATIAVLHSRPLADSTPTLRSPSDYFSDTLLGRAAGNGHRILERLYERPITSVAEVRELLGTTFGGANQIVQRLVALKILNEITGQARNR